MFSTHYSVSSRQNQLIKFKDDPEPGVILSSINMLGEGQNVTEANHIIFFTQTKSKVKYYQAIGRCHRYPQHKPVHIHLLFGSEFDKAIYEHACGNDIKALDWIGMLNQNKI